MWERQYFNIFYIDETLYRLDDGHRQSVIASTHCLHICSAPLSLVKTHKAQPCWAESHEGPNNHMVKALLTGFRYVHQVSLSHCSGVLSFFLSSLPLCLADMGHTRAIAYMDTLGIHGWPDSLCCHVTLRFTFRKQCMWEWAGHLPVNIKSVVFF